MPDLIHSLHKQDLGHLRIIAEFWGLELEARDADSAREELTASLLDFDLLTELLAALSPQADSALTDLVNSGGKIPWAAFTRKYGDLREMGAGKRDRERPQLKPASTAEILFYRGLLAKAFFETDKGSQEFAYIPDDLLELIATVKDPETQGEPQKETGPVPLNPTPAGDALGRPASPKEKGTELLADDSLLDDATTLLAALRMGRSNWQFDLRLHALLTATNLIQNNTLQPEAVKHFLELPRSEALQLLTAAWMQSTAFNELKLMPDLVCEGEWTNQPQETREFLLNLLNAIPEGKWWSLNSFIRDIKTKYADFQRPAGDYDSWFIKRATDGQYLRGFQYWDAVDGALVKYFITNTLYWLGQVDLSMAEGATEPTSFRLSSFDGKKEEKGKIAVISNGKISIPRDAPRVVRYQISRFCEWDETKGSDYKYHITAQSLRLAKEQGLKAEQLLALLAKHTNGNVPPPLVKSLKRWEAHGVEARVETQAVLRVSKPEILEEMRKSKAAKHLGEVLSPTAVIVKGGAIQKVLEALTELGLLTEDLSEIK
jgi:hypothetical protein